jgi:hypothetical protein
MRNWFVEKAEKVAPKLTVKSITALLLCVISAATSVCTDIGVVGALSGGILGTSMMYIFPPIMYLGALRKQTKSAIKHVTIVKADGTTEEFFYSQNSAKRRMVSVLNSVLLLCGVGVGVFGTISSIKSAMA